MRISHQKRLILQVFLDARDEALYGFRVSQVAGVKTGSLYPILHELVEEGWLTADWEQIDEHVEGRRRRRFYRLTPQGERNAKLAVAGDSGALRSLMPAPLRGAIAGSSR